MARLLPFLTLVLALTACNLSCTPAQAPTPMGWRSQYTDHKPDPRVNTIVGTYYVDTRFNAARRASIDLAMDHWNVVLNGRIKFQLAKLVNFSDPLEATIFEASHELSDASPLFFVWEDATDPTLPPGALAYVTELGSPVVHLIDGRMDFTFYPEIIVAHEVGHSMGLDHSDVANTLMSRTYNQQPRCVDEISVRTLAAQMRWEPETLNWCAVP